MEGEGLCIVMLFIYKTAKAPPPLLFIVPKTNQPDAMYTDIFCINDQLLTRMLGNDLSLVSIDNSLKDHQFQSRGINVLDDL